MKNITCLLFICVFTACNFNSPEVKMENVDSIKSDIVDMLDNYHQDIKKDGLMAEFKYLDTSSNFFWVPPGYNTSLSYDGIKNILEGNSATYRSIDFKWNGLKIFPLTPEIANYSGTVDGTLVDTSGIISQVSIIESGTLIKRLDGWKLLNGQSRVVQGASN